MSNLDRIYGSAVVREGLDWARLMRAIWVIVERGRECQQRWDGPDMYIRVGRSGQEKI